MKSIIASGILLGMAHGVAVSPVVAGPYVETEGEFVGVDADYAKSKIQGRLGYKFDAPFNPYVEIGGGAITPDGGDSAGFLATEVGGKVEITDNLSAKASVENLRYDGDNNWKVKVGSTYKF